MIDRLRAISWRDAPLIRTLWPWPRRITCAVALPILAATIRLRVIGREHIPPTGPVLVASNHLHNADPILLGLAMPRPLNFMAKRELFTNPVLAWMMRRAGAFQVDRGRADRAAIREAENRLRRGAAVGLFPEGTRSETGWLQSAHAGVGLIAVRAGVPILPVAITGSERLPFNGSKQSSSGPTCWEQPLRVTIRFGEPFTLPTRVDGRPLSSEAATDVIMAAIADLLPGAYQRAGRAGKLQQTTGDVE